MEPFIYQKGEIPFFSLESWQEQFPHLVIGFSCRLPNEDDWNLSNYAFHVGNSPNLVIENRKKLTEQLHIPFTRWTCGEQVHGTHIETICAKDRGRGSLSQDTAIPSTDGLLTLEEDLLLTSFYADCVPLLFYSPDLDLIGVAHAGWKGTVNRIGQKMVKRMVQMGAKVEQIRVAIAPSIGVCCYEVDNRVIEPLKHLLQETSGVFKSADHTDQYYLDLKQANIQLLLQLGISFEHITQSKWCTSCQRSFFHSHRRDQGDTGRMVAWIGKRKGGA